MEKNLIEKLAGKWADFKYAVRHSKIARRIATLMLAGAMAVPLVLSASACQVTIKDNGDGTFDINPVDPNPGDGTGNNQGNQQGGNQQGGNTDDPKPEPDYSKYSPLLQEVLTDPSYDELYRMYEKGELNVSSQRVDVGTNLLEAIPYNYLASKGEDIEGIKNGAVAVKSDIYTIENDKNYVYDKVDVLYRTENKSYINQYLLKYEISEQELKDLTMLYNGRYYQGPVMFQKLASKQQPEVISEFSLTEKAIKSILTNCNNKNDYIAKLVNYDDIKNVNILSMTPTTLWNEPAYNIKFNFYSDGGNNSVSKCNIYEIDAQIVVSSCNLTMNNNIYDMDKLYPLNSKLVSSTPITYFQLENAFKNVKTNLN